MEHPSYRMRGTGGSGWVLGATRGPSFTGVVVVTSGAPQTPVVERGDTTTPLRSESDSCPSQGRCVVVVRVHVSGPGACRGATGTQSTTPVGKRK